MDEFGSVVFVIVVVAFLLCLGWVTGYSIHINFINRYECKDERIVDHEVVCYRYELEERKQ